MKNTGVSIVIPAYNEENRIIETLHQLFKFAKNGLNTLSYEVIIINDCSTDLTLEYLNIAKSEHKEHLFILSNDKNMGKGYSVIKGCKSANYPLIVILDADYSVKLDELLYLPEKCYLYMEIEKPFAFNGIRYFDPPYPVKRKILHICYKSLIRLMFDRMATDTQCPFKLLYLPHNQLFTNWHTNRYAYDLELLERLRKRNVPIFEKAVLFCHKESMNVGLKSVLPMLKEVIMIFLRD